MMVSRLFIFEGRDALAPSVSQINLIRQLGIHCRSRFSYRNGLRKICENSREATTKATTSIAIVAVVLTLEYEVTSNCKQGGFYDQLVKLQIYGASQKSIQIWFGPAMRI